MLISVVFLAFCNKRSKILQVAARESYTVVFSERSDLCAGA